jgi:D-lactate dehydrogenase
VQVHRCGPEDTKRITSFRFAAASAFRTWCVGRGLQGVSIDYALPKNYIDCPSVTDLGVAAPATRMRYSHFGCNVVHEDLAFAAGVDTHAAKMAIKHRVEALGGALPAEHGHGVEYTAPPAQQQRWRQMDPSNTMNPGVGGLEYTLHYKDQKSSDARGQLLGVEKEQDLRGKLITI